MNLARPATILVIVTPAAFSQTWDYVFVSEKGLSPGLWEANYGKGTWTETYGPKKVMIRSEETVFLHPQNGLFMGFCTRIYQEAKRPD